MHQGPHLERRFFGSAASAWTLVLLIAVTVHAAWGFRSLEVGQPLESFELVDPSGEARDVLGEEGATVLAFVRPSQERSAELIHWVRGPEAKRSRSLAAFRWVLAGAPGEAEAEFVENAASDEVVLVDDGERLYGRLGVSLLPVVGIFDSERRLRAYIPYRKVNFGAAIEAHLERVAGTISEEELQRRLAPKAASIDGDREKAARYLKMATMLFERGKVVDALASLDHCLELDAESQSARALRLRALVVLGRCAEAREALGEIEDGTVREALEGVVGSCREP